MKISNNIQIKRVISINRIYDSKDDGLFTSSKDDGLFTLNFTLSIVQLPLLVLGCQAKNENVL